MMHLNPGADGHQQMIVLIEIVDRADIKSGLVFSADRDCGLIKNFTADGELFRHLLLQQPADEPKILIHRTAAVVDLMATTA